MLSCNKVINNPVQHFDQTQRQNLHHSRIIQLEEYDILEPKNVIRIDDSYMVWDNNNEKMFNLVNFNLKKVIKGIGRGNGPGEIISPSSFQLKEGRFFLFDVASKKINQIEISDITLRLKEIEAIDFDKRLFGINYLGSHIIATGIFEDYWLASIRTDGKVVSRVDFPKFEETDNTPKVQLSILYISTHMANSPDNKKMIAVTQDHGVISFFNCIDNSILKEYKQIKYYGPSFSIQERGNIAYSKDGLIGFCGLDCDDEYVYALYSGRTFNEHGMLSHHCENILVYDWDGNPVKHYTLDIPLFSMKFDKEKNTIYGIGYNPEGVFVEYQLDDLMVEGNK